MIPEVAALPPVVDVPTAGALFGLGRDSAYRSARNGTFPVPIVTVGRRLMVLRSDLDAVLSGTVAPA